jgi:hypothetical protein
MLTIPSRPRPWFALGQLITATLGVLGLVTSPGVESWLVWLILAAAAITALMLVTLFGPAALRNVGRRSFIFVCQNFVISRMTVILLLAISLVGLVVLISPIPFRLPDIGFYLPFVLLWPWFTMALLPILGDPGRNRLQPLVRKLVRASFSLVLFWATLELLLQAGFNHLPTTLILRMPQASIRSGQTYDPSTGIHEYAPGVVNYTMNGYTGELTSQVCPAIAAQEQPTTVHYTRDDHGFRNPTPWPDHADMVVLGDSLTAGEAVQHPYWDGISPSLLEFGLPGSGSAEQLALLRKYGLPRTPKVVVMAFFEGNDLADTWRFQFLRSLGETEYNWDIDTHRPWEFLVTYQAIFWLRDILNPKSGCAQQIKDDQGHQFAFLNFHLSMLTLDKDELRQSDIFAATRNAIVNAAKESQAAGATFVLMFIPDNSHVHWHGLVAAGQLSALGAQATAIQPTTDGQGLAAVSQQLTPAQVGELMNRNLDTQRDLLGELANQTGFLFLDLTPMLQAAADGGILPYFYADSHWNQQGHDLARTALTDFLAAHHLLNGS